uniref:hypothetical protein n=1 Tax=uncultured Altererythrobacter sp. TaxID=500840 RepID=UPI002625938A|nr:hypothetical protein [uncultured Altererythrobacter sp.]
MATRKQIAANRRNAKKSSGPTSAAGKAASSRNSLKHGVLSQRAVADHEDRQAYESLLRQLIDEYRPETALECTLVERLSILIWREKRLAETEAELFKHRHKNAQELAFADFLKALPLSDQHLIGRYQGMIGRQIRDMLKNLREEQDLRLKAIQAPSKDEG